MKLVIYTAGCCGDATNCEYPNRVEVTNAAELAEAVGLDHVAAKYKNNYRGIDNFEEAVVIEMDCDNGHSDDPADWITPEKLAEDLDLGDVDFATTPSRHNMLPKGSKSPRPRFHVHFPIGKCTDPEEIAAMKRALQKKYPFFDDGALDAGRFLFGTPIREDEVFWHEGFLTVDEILIDMEDGDEDAAPPADGTILEGSRNNTMSHFAGRVLKRHGVCDKAHDLYLERAEKCDPPLSATELEHIWRSAVKFAGKVQGQSGYVPPNVYNDAFGGDGSLKPEDYSDIGEARILSVECAGSLRYTSGTDYLAFGGDRWHEDGEKALGMVEKFLDRQLIDAQGDVTAAETALTAGYLNE